MVVGILDIHLRLPCARSLKDKRQIVKSLLARIRSTYGASAAEVDLNDVRQRARLGVAYVAGTEFQARKVLSSIQKTLECLPDAEVIDMNVEFVGIEE